MFTYCIKPFYFRKCRFYYGQNRQKSSDSEDFSLLLVAVTLVEHGGV